jgi:NADPH2:quinone reductase
MKAIWYQEYGAASEVLVYGDRDKPTPAAGEVLVRLHASAVNPSDVKKRAGAQPDGFPGGYVIPHSDGAGIIEAVGEGVGDRAGERVWVYQAQFGRHCGTTAEYVALPSELAATLPENTPFEIGACLGIPVMTAHRCVYNCGDPSGKTILVTGGSGRVGYYAAQFARLGGARVITTAGSDERCAIAAQTGADQVLNYRSGNLVEDITRIAGENGVDHIVDVEFGVNADVSTTVATMNREELVNDRSTPLTSRDNNFVI